MAADPATAPSTNQQHSNSTKSKRKKAGIDRKSSGNGRSRRAPQTVTTEGAWCCAARPLASPSPPPRRSSAKQQHRDQFSNPPAQVSSSSSVEESVKQQVQVSAPVVTQISESKSPSPSPSPNNHTNPNSSSASGSALCYSNQSPTSNPGLSSFRIRLSPGRVSPIMDHGYGKFNSVLNAGLLNPSSSPPVEKIRSSPTLFEMMAHEQEMPKHPVPVYANGRQTVLAAQSVQDRHALLQERISAILGNCSPGNQFNDSETGDVKLTLSSKDGFSVSLNVHREILVAHSRFFSSKLSERWSKQQQRNSPQLIEISDCEDVEVYVETLRLMYCKDIKRRLLKENVAKVLGILKVSAAIVFDAGMLSCLEYLEAVPWTEEEEMKITLLLSQLQLESMGAGEVLRRITDEDSTGGGSEEILIRLFQLVLDGTDDKARRDMKALVSRMLRENAQSRDSYDVSKDSLYHTCKTCLDSLLDHFMKATSCDIMERPSEERGFIVNQIARQSDNLHWLLDILIDRHIADDFVRIWANQSSLAALHSRIPTMYRYEVSRLTARLCIALGKGQILVNKEIRYSLLQTWLQPLFDDFGWMRRACKSLDRKVIEDGVSQTILTLPLRQQQNILLNWFDRFLSNGDDCPNLQKAFEVWWRRTYVRSYVEAEQNQLEVAS
eukprot:TRINITY_DN13525_c0_g1_i1.p1 TRINITY_DN13525_c0_g1~~TRINITY_DN13525_c0_g1_i1.p1  ORF type:complete len:665 (+),score=98.79 TRINITY_DN13525_c0_g1_i1:424-2418(+)